MYADSHLHTHHSSDSQIPVRDQIEAAIALGMPTLAITDHYDYDQLMGTDKFPFIFDVPQYFEELLPLKELYKDKIKLRIGIECGLRPFLSKEIAALVQAWPFDFVIGSVHMAENMNPYYPSFYEGRTEKEAYTGYFMDVLKNVIAHDDFDTLGHIDYTVRYGPNKNRFYTYETYSDILEEILKVLIQKGKALECNTGGLRSGLGYAHPHPGILKRYRELGGEMITLGSDAHIPQDIGYGFNELGDYLKSFGFSYYTIFEKRKPVFLPL